VFAIPLPDIPTAKSKINSPVFGAFMESPF